MGVVKETRIMNLQVVVGIDEHDPSNLGAVVQAATATNDGQVVHVFSDDITDMISAETIAILQPVIQRVYGRIMEARNITPGDLAEGAAYVQQQQEQLMQQRRRTEQPDEPPEPVDQDAIRAQMQAEMERHQQEVEDAVEATRRADEERIAAEHEEQRRQAEASDTYAADRVIYERNIRQVEEEKRRQRREEEGEDDAPRARRRLDRPTRPTR
jgi:hypothetical protein